MLISCWKDFRKFTLNEISNANFMILSIWSLCSNKMTPILGATTQVWLLLIIILMIIINDYNIFHGKAGFETSTSVSQFYQWHQKN